MPSVSKAQRRLMAIAEHDPSEVYNQNLGVLKMSHQQLHDFAATKEKTLPAHVHAKKGHPGKNLGTFLHKRKRR